MSLVVMALVGERQECQLSVDDKSGRQCHPISCCMTIVGLDDVVEQGKG